MAKWKDLQLTAALKERRREADGAIFQWLWDNHAAIQESMRTGFVGWDAISERIRVAGASGRYGGKASRWQVARTWAVVCRRKERAETQQEARSRVGKAKRRISAHPPSAEGNRSKPPTAAPFASGHVTEEAPRQILAEVPDSTARLPKVPSCVIPPNETPEERIARNQRLLDEQFRRTDAWMGMPVTRKKP